MKRFLKISSMLASLVMLASCSGGMSSRIKTMTDLNHAITSTYLYGAVAAVVFVLIMLLLTSLVDYQKGALDNSGKTRKVWFFVLMFVAFFTSLIVNYVVFYQNVQNAQFQNTYMMHMIIAALMVAVLYFLIGFLFCKMQNSKNNKWSTIFPSKN